MWESNIKLLVGVGYVVPALIAHDMGRQGIKKTVRSVMLAGCIVAVPIALALLLNMPGVNDLAPLRGGGDLAIEVGWIPIAVLLSAGSAWGVARFWGLRSGGFMGAAFVAILLGDPWQVLVTGVLAVMTYILVTRFLMNSMILFGRRKFSAMLLVSASMSWILLWIGGEMFGLGLQSHMDIGSLALTPLIVPGLLANDAQRTSPLHVVGGLSVATVFVLSTTWWVQSIAEDRPLDLSWKLTAVASAVAIFGRSILLEWPSGPGRPTRQAGGAGLPGGLVPALHRARALVRLRVRELPPLVRPPPRGLRRRRAVARHRARTRPRHSRWRSPVPV